MNDLTEIVDREIDVEETRQAMIINAAQWDKSTMSAGEALVYCRRVWDAGFTDFNGCSFAPDMGIKEPCNVHDTLWSLLDVHGIHRHRTDAILRELIISRGGIKYFIVGWFYWSSVRFFWLGGFYKLVSESYRHIKRFFGK